MFKDFPSFFSGSTKFFICLLFGIFSSMGSANADTDMTFTDDELQDFVKCKSKARQVVNAINRGEKINLKVSGTNYPIKRIVAQGILFGSPAISFELDNGLVLKIIPDRPERKNVAKEFEGHFKELDTAGVSTLKVHKSGNQFLISDMLKDFSNYDQMYNLANGVPGVQQRAAKDAIDTGLADLFAQTADYKSFGDLHAGNFGYSETDKKWIFHDVKGLKKFDENSPDFTFADDIFHQGIVTHFFNFDIKKRQEYLKKIWEKRLAANSGLLLKKDSAGNTLLSFALEKNYPSLAQWLLEKIKAGVANSTITAANAKDYVNTKNNEKISSLRYAIASNMVDEVKGMIALGADLNEKYDMSQITPLMHAIDDKHQDVAQNIMAAHQIQRTLTEALKAKATDERGPLHFAIGAGMMKLADSIIDNMDTAAVSSKDKEGMTPLHYLALSTKLDINAPNAAAVVDKLLAKMGNEVETKDQAWQASSLMYALTKNEVGHNQLSKKIIDQYLTQFGNLDKINAQALEKILQRGNLEMLKYIKDKGVDIRRLYGEIGPIPASFYAVESDNKLQILDYLKIQGVDLKLNDNHPTFQSTPLMFAVSLGDMNLAKKIIELDPTTVVTKSGKYSFEKTPLHFAIDDTPKDKKEAMVQLLLDRGANISTPDQFGVYPIGKAVSLGDGNILNMVKKKDPQGLDRRDPNTCQTYYQLASKSSHLGVRQIATAHIKAKNSAKN